MLTTAPGRVAVDSQLRGFQRQLDVAIRRADEREEELRYHRCLVHIWRCGSGFNLGGLVRRRAGVVRLSQADGGHPDHCREGDKDGSDS